MVAKLGEVGLVTELPGRLEASRVAQVRARAAGIVQKRLFKEGSTVKAGQPLFTIDSAPYQATLQSAKAQLARAEANAAQAASLAKRYRPLVQANAISKQEYANAVAAQKTTEADVAVARAAVQTAQINVGYASVTAPISGRIGRALVTEGALVGQGEATPLALVQQIDPLFVNFTQSSSEALRLRRAFADGKLQRASDGNAAQVQVVLEDGSVYPQPGKLLFSDLTVDASTGQITLRAEIPNTKNLLLPGMYVRVRNRASPARQRDHAAAAGRHTHPAGRQRDGGERGRQAVQAQCEDRCRARQPVGGAGRPEGGRAGDGRRLPEAADDAAGHPREGGAVAAAGCGADGQWPPSGVALQPGPRGADAGGSGKPMNGAGAGPAKP